jgi:hypothetical protein
MNTAATIAQVASPIVSFIFIVVLGVGYYYQWKVSQRTLEEMRAARMAGGRPQVIVDADYASLPQVDIAVRNISGGAAKDITFEFSAPVVSSDGVVISDLTYFKNGLDFLEPNGEIYSHWDHLGSLLPFLEEKGLEGGISVTTRYKDLAGESYETEWNLNPYIYKDRRYVKHKGMNDVVERLDEIAANSKALLDAAKEVPGEGDGPANRRGGASKPPP